MPVRAKFKVTQKTQHEPWSFEADKVTPKFIPTQVTLAPVMAKSGEDSIFGAATPSGEIRMMIQNDQAAAQFEPGKAYYIDLTPAE